MVDASVLYASRRARQQTDETLFGTAVAAALWWGFRTSHRQYVVYNRTHKQFPTPRHHTPHTRTSFELKKFVKLFRIFFSLVVYVLIACQAATHARTHAPNHPVPAHIFCHPLTYFRYSCSSAAEKKRSMISSLIELPTAITLFYTRDNVLPFDFKPIIADEI